MYERLITGITRFGRLASDLVPKGSKAIDYVGKHLGPIVGKGAVGGFKAGAGVIGKGLGKIAEFNENGTARKIASNAGKFSGYVARDVEDTIRGVNNLTGLATNGVEIKSLNKVLNKGIDMIPETNKAGAWVKNKIGTNRFDGHRYVRLLKDSDESILLGKRATGLGVGIIAGGGMIMSTKDAAVDKLRAQQGRVVGSASNAPVNNYAYQGASYADNAGATGDLVLSMHRQRHSGIL